MLAVLFSKNGWKLCSQWRIMPKSMIAQSGFPFFASSQWVIGDFSVTFESSAVWWVLLSYRVSPLTPQHLVWLTRVENALNYLSVNDAKLGTPFLRPSLCVRHVYLSGLTQTFWDEERVTELWEYLHSVRPTLLGSISTQGSGISVWRSLSLCTLCRAPLIFNRGQSLRSIDSQLNVGRNKSISHS